MGTVFVTGGSGFVGARLIQRLVTRGDDVRALSRSERSDTRLHELGATPLHGNLGDPVRLSAAMTGAREHGRE